MFMDSESWPPNSLYLDLVEFSVWSTSQQSCHAVLYTVVLYHILGVTLWQINDDDDDDEVVSLGDPRR